MWRLLVAFLGLACTDAKRFGCFSAEELEDGRVPVPLQSWTSRWHRHSSLQLVPFLENEQSGQQRLRRHHGHSCPIPTTKDVRNGDISKRSISPWRYHIDEDENRIPRKLAFAKCLCKGCINTENGQETISLGSVQVVQSMMVLRRKPCVRNNSAPGFYYEEEYIDLPVACTCVIPQYSS